MNNRERADLDRHITGNGGENSVSENLLGDPIGLLAAECDKVLEDFECSAVPAEKFLGPDVVRIHDCDGEHVADVSRTINAFDLRALIVRGRREYLRGVEVGGARMAGRLRTLLGAAPAEAS